jgi:hypothetical protein
MRSSARVSQEISQPLITEVILPRFLFGFRNKRGAQGACEITSLVVSKRGGAGEDLLASSLTKRRREQGHTVSGVWATQLNDGASFYRDNFH